MFKEKGGKQKLCCTPVSSYLVCSLFKHLEGKGREREGGEGKQGISVAGKQKPCCTPVSSCLSALNCEPLSLSATESSTREQQVISTSIDASLQLFFHRMSRFYWVEREREDPPVFAANHALCSNQPPQHTQCNTTQHNTLKSKKNSSNSVFECFEKSHRVTRPSCSNHCTAPWTWSFHSFGGELF